jgi:hypothetical protein
VITPRGRVAFDILKHPVRTTKVYLLIYSLLYGKVTGWMWPREGVRTLSA